jgi:tetratricopeptide (TPR) repeat protein
MARWPDWMEMVARKQASRSSRRKASRARIGTYDVRSYLATQSQEALVELVLTAAKSDPRYYQQLMLQAAKQSSKGVDVALFRDALERAIDPGEYIDHASSQAYADGIDEAVDALEELLKHGQADNVIELCEQALELIEESLEFVDDSDGVIGGILERVQDIHLEACRKGTPDPEALAQRLFHWELRTDWDTFYGAVDTYADVLGDKGLAVYRALAEAEWTRLPALGPGASHMASYDTKRFRITHIMETLAERSGDVEAVIAVKSRDLSSAYAYFRIAETYRQAGKRDSALEWAERGRQAFPQRTDARLLEFLAEEYHHRKRHDDAMAIVWAAFAEKPTLEDYRDLKRHADRTKTWPTWRERALAFVRDQITLAISAQTRNPSHRHKDHSELVRIFLWEGDTESAWTEARAGGCSNTLWLELATRRQEKHPADVLPICQSQLEPTLARKNNGAYQEAVELLRTIQTLMLRLGMKKDFAHYLQSLRVVHKPKRNFMKMLERARFETIV